MISLRRCSRCWNLFDVEKDNLSPICPDCIARIRADNEYAARNDFWGDSYIKEYDSYYQPRCSGTLSFIERNGENPPDEFIEKKMDRFIEQATSNFTEKRQAENDSILAAFADKKHSTIPNAQYIKSRQKENKAEDKKDEAQNDLLSKLFGPAK